MWTRKYWANAYWNPRYWDPNSSILLPAAFNPFIFYNTGAPPFVINKKQTTPIYLVDEDSVPAGGSF